MAGSCSGSLQCPLSRLDELLGSFYVSVRRFNTLVPFGGSFWAARLPIGGTQPPYPFIPAAARSPFQTGDLPCIVFSTALRMFS